MDEPFNEKVFTLGVFQVIRRSVEVWAQDEEDAVQRVEDHMTRTGEAPNWAGEPAIVNQWVSGARPLRE